MLAAYNYMRRGAKEVKIGKLAIGGKNPIAVQFRNRLVTY